MTGRLLIGEYNSRMPSAEDIYIHCDKLDDLPAVNRDNWLWESAWLCEHLKPNAKVLQVGSCEGSRIVNVMQERPDLNIIGIEIDPVLHAMAIEHFKKTGTDARSIRGDITNPGDIKELGHFDYCLCLNNTLGYIPDEEAAITQMKKLAGRTIVSVYGEKFTDNVAREYCAALTLDVETIIDDVIHVKNFGTIKRYRKKSVKQWNGKMTETPLGYLCVMKW